MKKWILSLLTVLFLLTPIQAASIPQPSEAFYVNDQADVLSEETEAKIIQLNDRLYEDYEVQFVVLTVGYLEGKSIDDYAYEVFNDWGIGTAKYHRGILLLLAIGEEDYYVLPGDGLENILTASVLSSLFRDYLEDDFASENYDEGVQSFMNAVDKKLTSSLKTLTSVSSTAPKKTNTIHFGTFLPQIFILLVLIFILAVIIHSGRTSRRRRRVYRVPRPPRRPMGPPPPPGPGPMYSRPRRSMGWRPSPPRRSSSWSSSSRPSSSRSSSSRSRSSAPRSGGGGRSRGGGAGRH